MFIKLFLDTGPENDITGQSHSFREIPNKLLIDKQRGYGKKILMDTFLYPNWYPARRIDKNNKKQQVNGGHLIICICLLLSGDIHQCPGPMPRNRSAPSKITSAGATWCINRPNAGEVALDARQSGIDREHGFAGRRRVSTKEGGLHGGEQASLRLPTPVAALGPQSFEIPGSASCEKPTFESFVAARGLHLLHLNVRSLLPKITEIRHLSKNSKVGILCFTETWLDDSVKDAEIELDNYLIVRRDRNRKGGGVCIYVRADIGFNHRTDLHSDQIEALWLDIQLPLSKPILIGVCYRPPDQSQFYELLEELCTQRMDLLGKEVILMGDFNTDVLKRDSPGYKALMNMCRSFGLDQLINEPTRICPKTETVIDLVLVSDKTKIAQSGVINYGLSDHCIIFCTRKTKKAVFNCHASVKARSMKAYNKDTFNERLKLMDWSAVLNCENVNESWGIFKSMFLEVIDKVAPFKETRIKQRSEPWVNDDILEAIRDRNKKFKHFRMKGDEHSWAEFKRARNEVNRLVINTKKIYFKEKIQEHRNDSRKLWKSLSQLGYSKQMKTKDSNITLDLGNTITSDKGVVAAGFNDYFSSVARNLVEKLPGQTGQYGEIHVQKYYSQLGVKSGSFTFESVSVARVLEKLQKLDCNKATGLDAIPARFLKDSAEIISPSITHIVNSSIRQGEFPNDLKGARVIPLYKKGSKQDPSNYRPVSILSSLSKIIEKIMYEQIDQYLLSQNILYEFQSGFRKSHSTDSCLLFLTDLIKREVDKGNLCGMVMLDLQKAFDTVDHSVLLYKLKAIGFSDLAVKWVGSYLGNRMQVVDTGGTISHPVCISCGVPQGSVLGPLLFLLYINDLKSVCSSMLFLYADDSALVVSHKDKDVIEQTLSTELLNVSSWMSDNRLSLHVGKTESILFGSKIRLKKASAFNIFLGDTELVAKETVSYLGCMLDNNLSGTSQAQKVITKVNQRVRFMARISKFLDTKTLVILAGALIQPYYDYACSSWYDGLTVNLKHRLQASQNKLVRLILDLPTRTHLEPYHFVKVGWLKVEDRIAFVQLCMAHRIVHGEVPKYFKNYFNRVNDVHNYSTRGSSTDFVPPRVRTNMGKESFSYAGSVLWNRLPATIKAIASLDSFKRNLKRWFQHHLSGSTMF